MNNFNAGCLELQLNGNNEWVLYVADGELELEQSFTLSSIFQLVHSTAKGNG